MIRRSFNKTIGFIFILLAFIQHTAVAESVSRAGFSSFQWPETDSGVLPDARLHETTKKAREEAIRAEKMAQDAEALANDLKANLNWDNFQTEIVSDGVQFTGRPAPQLNDNAYVGRILYRSGAEIIGSYNFIIYPGYSTWGLGVVTSPDTSPMQFFKGEVAAPAEIRSRPSTGVATFKNGDRFTGLYYLYFRSTDVVGVYENASRSLRFIGQMKTVDQVLQPTRGIVEDTNGKLLAVVQ